MGWDWSSVGIGLGLAGYIKFVAGVLQNQIKLNFATWLLMAVLNGILLISLILEQGNYSVLVIFTGGCVAVSAALLYRKQFAWGRFETFVTILISICAVVWVVLGVHAAVIAGLASITLSTVPQIVESFRKPNLSSAEPWLIFFLSDVCYFKYGKDWSANEIGYATAGMVCCGILVLINLRQEKKNERLELER